MPKAVLVFLVLVVSIGALTLACGSSSDQIQSINVTPAVADAQNYPNGQVQFTATGHYRARTVTPLQANWGWTSDQPSGVTITANGLAQCQAGASGTFSIGAWVSIPSHYTCALKGPYGNPICSSVVGTAQLTCP
jgi:hypothetical protein